MFFGPREKVFDGGKRKGVWLIASILFCALAAPARSQQPVAADSATSGVLPADPPKTESVADPQQSQQRLPARISGRVIDQSGVTISGARVTLARDDESPSQEVLTDDDGFFYFNNLFPGPFTLNFSFEGLKPEEFPGTVIPGESYAVPDVVLTVATQVTEVRVTLTPVEIATDEVHQEEKQRVFGIIPNFYVSYVPDAAPLTPRLKFELAWKSLRDPFTLMAVGTLAGIEQAQNSSKSYGQGTNGYAKRYGAAYADVASATIIGSAVLPTLLKQDPRFFYRGTGSKRSRILYALYAPFICKSDSGHWGPNYSNLGGSLAAGGLANLYYPSNRRGVGLVFTTTVVRYGEIAIANIFQEFFAVRFTRNVPNHDPAEP